MRCPVRDRSAENVHEVLVRPLHLDVVAEAVAEVGADVGAGEVVQDAGIGEGEEASGPGRLAVGVRQVEVQMLERIEEHSWR